MDINQLTETVIGAAIEVHRALGPGLLESAYLKCLCHELSLKQIPFRTEYPLPISYKGIFLECSYKIDLLIADVVVIELKSIEKIIPVHEAQLLTYLRLGKWPVGLLINFNFSVLKEGIKRRVLGFHQ